MLSHEASDTAVYFISPVTKLSFMIISLIHLGMIIIRKISFIAIQDASFSEKFVAAALLIKDPKLTPFL